MWSNIEGAASSVKEFLSDNLRSTIAVSAVAVGADITYSLLQRRNRFNALVSQLELGEKGRQQAGITLSNTGDSAHQYHESAIKINRDAEAARITRQLSHRGVCSVIVSDVGQGTTSLLKRISQRRPMMTIISLQNVVTMSDLNNVMRREFPSLVNTASLPTTFFVVSKLLRGGAQYFSSEAGSEESSESEDGEGDDIGSMLCFEQITDKLIAAATAARASSKAKKEQRSAAAAAAATVSTATVASQLSVFIQTKRDSTNAEAAKANSPVKQQQLQQQQKNEAECAEMDELDCPFFDHRPLLVFDDATEIDQNVASALVSFAHKSSLLRVAVVVQAPYKFFETRWAHSLKIIVPRPPNHRAISNYLSERSPYLTQENCSALARRVTGRNIGLASHLCIALEDMLCDEDINFQALASDDIVDVALMKLRVFAHATCRPLLLFTLAPSGDADLDAQRHACFVIAKKLLDKQAATTEGMSRAVSSSHDDDGSPALPPGTPNPAWYRALALKAGGSTMHVPSAPGEEELTFADFLEPEEEEGEDGGGAGQSVPLARFLELISVKRNFLPFRTSFDSISWRAPVYKFTLSLLLGEAGSALRKSADSRLKNLV